MNVIQEFESKLKIIGGEKVYSGREIMKTFGYDKWERFVGAVNRAKQEISDEKKQEENFMFVVNKSTGGRPKEDVFLTLGACYLVLKKCDKRKENVQLLLEYMSFLLEEKKQAAHPNLKKFFGFEKVFLLIVLFFLFLSIVYYAVSYVNLFNNNALEHDFTQFYKEDVITETKKQESVLKEYDQKIADITSPSLTGGIKNMDFDFETSLQNYISGPEQKQYSFEKGFNQRTTFLQKLLDENIVKAYFLLGNSQKYRESCSLLSPKNCLSTTKGNLKTFANFWEKTKKGYQIIEVRKAKSFPDKNIYCVIYKYQLKYDTSNNYVTETFNYTTQNKNGVEQITGRFCEKIQKGGKNIPCPFKLNTYYCK